MPDRRRLGRVNVIYAIVLVCWWEEGEKRGNGGWVRDLKVGQLCLSMGLAKAEVRSYVQTATISSKRVVYTLKY